MSQTWLRFSVFVAVSLILFIGVLLFVMRKRAMRPGRGAVIGSAFIVVVVGMVFAKYGSNAGWPWWIYYTVPAVVTLFLPPLVFHLRRRELGLYLALAFLSAPLIHVLFSLFLGWHEYMPFVHIPSLCTLTGLCAAPV
jgi:hypothetical protein